MPVKVHRETFIFLSRGLGIRKLSSGSQSVDSKHEELQVLLRSQGYVVVRLRDLGQHALIRTWPQLPTGCSGRTGREGRCLHVMELLTAQSCRVGAQTCLWRVSGSRLGTGGTRGLLPPPERRWCVRLSINN